MANTKSITDRGERKAAKRTQRKALKQTFRDMPPKLKKKFKKSETVGVRKFLAEQASGE